MGQWRNDWVDNGAGGYMIFGSGPGSGGPAGPGGSDGFLGAPGPVGTGPGYWSYDNFGGANQRPSSTGNDPGAGKANPSAGDHGAAVFNQGGSAIVLPRGAQSDTSY